MLQIIYCKTCGKEGRMPYRLEIEFNHKFCKSCGNTTHSGRYYEFCSEECLRTFVKKEDLIEAKEWEK